MLVHEILVSAQGPLVLGFWVWGFGVWGLGLTIIYLRARYLILNLWQAEAIEGSTQNNYLWFHQSWPIDPYHTLSVTYWNWNNRSTEVGLLKSWRPLRKKGNDGRRERRFVVLSVWPLCCYFCGMYTNIHTVSYNVFLTDCVHTHRYVWTRNVRSVSGWVLTFNPSITIYI